MDENERQRRAKLRKRRRKRQVLIGKLIIAALVLIIVVLCFFLAKDTLLKKKRQEARNKANTEAATESAAAGESQGAGTEAGSEVAAQAGTVTGSDSELLSQAEHMALQYDYDGAIELLKSSGSFAGSQKMQSKVSEYEAEKSRLVEYPLDQVTHVFYHTLIYDTSKAFDGDAKEGGYNQVMTTVDEFNKITQSMYDRGYVMVSLHDMCTVNEDGTVTPGKIMLPPGKKAFVLSQDDVSYYHYMDGDGMATKLIVDENGDIKNEYKEDDGSISIGDYDMVPLIDRFVEKHPDFAYHGHKGIIALTGYNGVLGYRTDIAYKTRENLDEYQELFFQQNPNFDEAAYNKEIEEATKVANAMKEEGWEFASHTWGHINVTEASLERLQTDTQKWLDYVKPIVGDTNVVIFAFGADLGDWQPYTSDNPKFTYMKSVGFDIFCNVDSTQYWVQFGDNFMRQGRRNLDGYRMYYNPEMVEDLFDANEVFDKARPTPVPAM
ncbi:MAG: polysaccharide deacetylase family protein [Hominisplanchenecus sp.]